MNKILGILSILAVFTSCKSLFKKTKAVENSKNNTKNEVSSNDTIPKVMGIGGIFFFSDNPNETREWYAKILGFDVNQWGSTFEFRNVKNPDEINQLQWSPFKTGSDYFSPSKKQFMVNYRVQNMEGLVRNLKTNGVTILDEIQTFEYGKFVHIMDSEGNKIELWEPINQVPKQ